MPTRSQQELASAQDEFSRTLSRINDLFWTVEILPDGEITLTYLSANASGVVGKDVHAGLDALAFREGLGHPDDARGERRLHGRHAGRASRPRWRNAWWGTTASCAGPGHGVRRDARATGCSSTG